MPDLDGLNQILMDLAKYQLDLDGSSQISALMIKPEIDKTRISQSDEIFWVSFVLCFIHLKFSGQVWAGHKPNPARSMNIPMVRNE